MVMTLIDRLSKLDGPDRGLDAAIHAIFNDPIEGIPNLYANVPTYTRSVDAAIALAERVLPGYRWSAGFSRHVPHNAQIWVPSESGYYEGESDANRAIAICIALLRAKEASHDA